MKQHLNISKLMNSKGLGARALRGGVLVGMGNASEQAARLARNMILTRILAPDAFGLMAVILAINGLFQAATEIGIKEAIIQNPRGEEPSYLNGAWWLSFVRGIVLYCILFFTSPFIADFYSNADLVVLLRVSFVSIVLIGAISPLSSVSMKHLKYGRWVIFFNGGGLIGIVSTLIMSHYFPNVLALVIGFLIENLSRFLLSYILFPFFPGISFAKEDLRALFKFASGMVGLPILTLIFLKTDVFVVGKFCSISDLGLYSMAVAVAWMPFRFITMVTSRIMMPAFSERQKDKQWINRWTLKITSIIIYAGFPMFFFMIFYGKPFLHTIYGPEYGTVSIPFSIIFLVALLRTCSVPIAAIYLSSGNPQLHRRFTLIRAVLILIIIVPMVRQFGLTGAATSALTAMTISYIFQMMRLKSLTGINLIEYISLFLHGTAISVSVLLFWGITHSIPISNPVFKMLPGVLGILISYLIAAIFLYRTLATQKPSPTTTQR